MGRDRRRCDRAGRRAALAAAVSGSRWAVGGTAPRHRGNSTMLPSILALGRPGIAAGTSDTEDVLPAAADLWPSLATMLHRGPPRGPSDAGGRGGGVSVDHDPICLLY